MSTPLSVWILASRPKTLTAGAIPVIAATALAWRDAQTFIWWVPACALLSALLIQIATNFINDAWDFKKGTDTSERLGPERATQLGLISAEALLKASGFVLLLALGLGVPLVIHGGLPILAIGLMSLFFAWAYTAGPYPLAYNGLGELFVLIFFGIIAVGGTYYLCTQSVSLYSFLLGLQIGIFSVLIIAINNLRDIEGDTKASKRTLAVIFGAPIARKAISFFSISPLLLGIAWLPYSVKAASLPLLLLPLALHIANSLQTLPPGKIFNQFLAKAALLHALFGAIISAALIWH